MVNSHAGVQVLHVLAIDICQCAMRKCHVIRYYVCNEMFDFQMVRARCGNGQRVPVALRPVFGNTSLEIRES